MNTVLVGDKQTLITRPQNEWQRELMRHSRHIPAHLNFMTADHHRVRDFVVLELPRQNRPLNPGQIAATLDLEADRVQLILDELEANLTFLFRNATGAVAWAYPVTVEPTPHQVFFSSGEQIYAA